jgi:hypothetical protein
MGRDPIGQQHISAAASLAARAAAVASYKAVLIRQLIRQRSVALNQFYEKGCRCGINGATASMVRGRLSAVGEGGFAQPMIPLEPEPKPKRLRLDEAGGANCSRVPPQLRD